ncbi:SAM domain-containing protein [Aphelenchoides bicaudatus]|nr:SAM domain-containing protein [Aphelenchoides bicaudatus]
MPSPIEIWKRFFEACDLPTKIQNKYAETFTNQRIQPNMLADLDKTTLRELGVDTLGDQLAILRYIKQTNGVDAPAFKLIQPGKKEPVTTTHRDSPDRHVMRVKATSSSVQIPMNSRSIAIKKPQIVSQRSGGLRSDEILRERGVTTRQIEMPPRYRDDRPLIIPNNRQTVSSLSIVRRTQFSVRDIQRRSAPSSNIRDRVTFGQRGGPVPGRRYYD